MQKTLSDYRIEKGLSKIDMADKLDIAVTTYFQYENGQRKIPADIADKIVKILKISRCKNDIFMPSTFSLRETNSENETMEA